MKRFRVALLIGGMFSCLFSMELVFGSRMFFRNMYDNHFIYEINIYAQMLSIVLFMVLLFLLLIRKMKPYYFTIVGAITVLINVIALVIYISSVDGFYINMYIFRGLVLLLIGLFLQSEQIKRVKALSLYFFLEFLIIQITSLSEESVFFMHKTFEMNLIGVGLMFALGIMIPLCMNYFIVDGYSDSGERTRVSISINSIIKYTSLISIAYLTTLIILNLPYINAILVDASSATIFHYRMRIVLKIILYSLLIYSFVSVILDSVKRWLFPVITIAILVTAIYPLTLNIQFYLERFDWLYGVTFDLVVLIVMAVFIYFRKYKISFILSVWLLINFATTIQIGNVQSWILLRDFNYRNLEIFVQILYYFIPLTLSLILYNKMNLSKERDDF